MAPKQKIPSASCWLINIGLTLQFYIPWAFLLYIGGVDFYSACTVPPEEEFMEGVLFGISLLLLVVTVPWCTLYLFWDRHGSRFNALCFLIATSLLACGFFRWITIERRVDGAHVDGPLPLLVVIPTLLYIVALLLLIPKNAS